MIVFCIKQGNQAICLYKVFLLLRNIDLALVNALNYSRY